MHVPHAHAHAIQTRVMLIKNEVRCRDDTVPKTVDTSMQRVTEQKREMEDVKQLQSQERLKLEKRKKAIDIGAVRD